MPPDEPRRREDSAGAGAARSPDWFLDEVVRPTLDAFLLQRDCVRRGMLASLAVSSLADHIAVARSERSGVLSLHPAGVRLTGKDGKRLRDEVADFRGDLAKRCPEFVLVRDVADATKHARLDRGDARIRDVSGVQHRVEVIVTRGGLPLSLRDGSLLATSGVVVVLSDGSRHPLAKLLTGALACLRKKMKQ